MYKLFLIGCSSVGRNQNKTYPNIFQHIRWRFFVDWSSTVANTPSMENKFSSMRDLLFYKLMQGLINSELEPPKKCKI